MTRTSRFDLFLSHASEDLEAVTRLKEWLERFFDLKIFASSISPGDDWQKAIDAALDQCRVGLVLATPRSIKKPWVNYEIGRLKEKGKPVFIFCWELTRKRLGSILNRVQACSGDDSIDKQRQFVEALAVALRKIPHLVSLDKNPLVQAAVPAISHFTNRDAAQAAIVGIIKRAQEAQKELCVAGVANTDFFSGAAAVVRRTLEDALNRGLRARFIFLDPSSGVARRRHIYELNRVETFTQIESCRTIAAGFCKKYPGRFQMRLSQDMPFFVCLNHENVICQPYFNTAVGAETFTWQLDLDARDEVQDHFESLWGTRWVLFDFGNLLVPFDHARVSRSLLKCLPRKQRDVRSQERIHNFIFGADESIDGRSRNVLLERKERDLAWLWNGFRKEFSVTISLEKFRKAWCSIFDEAHGESLRCLAEVRKLGVNVGICSNTNVAHWDYIHRCYPAISAPGIRHFLSFNFGAVKTEAKFFDEIVKITERPHEEHVLIDDLPQNIAAAERSRVRGINVTPPVRFETVRDFLLLHHWI